MESLAKLSGLSHAKKDHLIHVLWSIVGELRQEVSGLRECTKRVRCASGVSDLWGVFPDTRVPRLSALKLRSTSLSTCRRRSARLAEPGLSPESIRPAKFSICLNPCWRSPNTVPGKPAVAVVIYNKGPSPTRSRLQCSTEPVSRPPWSTSQYHMLPAKRTGELLEAWCGAPPSTGTVMNLIEQGRRRLEAPHRALAEALLRQPVVGADETGARVEGRLHWLHVLASESLSWLSVHPKRGLLAFEALGVLPRFRNILVHDGFKSYAKLECAHALCNAHLLRELTFQAEFRQQDWAKAMIGLLCEALKTTRLHPQGLSRSQVEDLRSRYEAVLEGGWKLNPPEPPDGGPGRTAQTDTVNLLQRLQDEADEVLHFTRNPQVTFTNNEAEREVRMPKVKLKVAGCFRTPWGVQAFCITRSYLSTLKKQERELLPSLEATFKGDDPLMGLDI